MEEEKIKRQQESKKKREEVNKRVKERDRIRELEWMQIEEKRKKEEQEKKLKDKLEKTKLELEETEKKRNEFKRKEEERKENRRNFEERKKNENISQEDEMNEEIKKVEKGIKELNEYLNRGPKGIKKTEEEEEIRRFHQKIIDLESEDSEEESNRYQDGKGATLVPIIHHTIKSTPSTVGISTTTSISTGVQSINNRRHNTSTSSDVPFLLLDDIRRQNEKDFAKRANQLNQVVKKAGIINKRPFQLQKHKKPVMRDLPDDPTARTLIFSAKYLQQKSEMDFHEEDNLTEMEYRRQRNIRDINVFT